MKKMLIYAIILTATMHLNAQFLYLFLNVTGKYWPGYTLKIYNALEEELCILEKNEFAYAANSSRYHIVALKNGITVGEHDFTPAYYNPLYEPDRTVIAIDFGKLIPRGFNITQYTMQEARELYGKRIQFMD